MKFRLFPSSFQLMEPTPVGFQTLSTNISSLDFNEPANGWQVSLELHNGWLVKIPAVCIRLDYKPVNGHVQSCVPDDFGS